MVDAKKEIKLLPICSDWRIDETGGRQFGICMVEVPPPQDYLSFKRGFPLTNPGHVRCAIFSLRLALEICLGGEQIPGPATFNSQTGKDEPGAPINVRVLRDFFSIIITRSQIVFDTFCGERAEKNMKWASDPHAKPPNMFGYSKSFFCSVFEMIETIVANKLGDISCTPMEKNEEGKSILMSHKVNLDIDPEMDSPATEDQQLKEMRVDAMRHRQYLRNELMETGARSTRVGRQLTKKERRAIVKKDDVKLAKDGAGTKSTAVGAGPAGPAGTKSGPISGPTGKPVAGPAGTSAVATGKPVTAGTSTSAGHVSSAPRDADSNVQDAKHGAVGGEQPVAN